MTAAFWRGGESAGRSASRSRLVASRDRSADAEERFASRIYEDMGALDLAAEAAERDLEGTGGFLGLGASGARLRLRQMWTGAARSGARARAGHRADAGDHARPRACLPPRPQTWEQRVSAAEGATAIDPESPEAWSAYAHALARTDRMQECVAACERALTFGADAEVVDLLDRARAAIPHVLAERSAA